MKEKLSEGDRLSYDREHFTIVLIILTYNQREKTLHCLEYLHTTQTVPFKILVWDNGSTDGTVQSINEAFPDVLTQHHPKNLGVASGRNAAAKLAIQTYQPTHLLFLDNDMLVEPGFVDELYKPFTDDNQIGQTQAKLRFQHDRTRLNDGGGCRINFIIGSTKPVGYNEKDLGQFDNPKSCIACGGAMMVRTDVFQEVEGFDEIFSPFGPEDLDFSLRLKNAGYTAIYVPSAVAYHEVSHSFSNGYSETYAQYKTKHWLIFLHRHASPIQKLSFFMIGAPILLTRMVFREGKKGNLIAIRGSVKGFLRK